MNTSSKPKTPGRTTPNATVSGRFILSVGRENGPCRGVVADFPNMILDVGLDFLAGKADTSPRPIGGKFAVGSSGVAVTPDQTNLLSPIRYLEFFAKGSPTFKNTQLTETLLETTAVHLSRGSPRVGRGTVVVAEMAAYVDGGYYGSDTLCARALVRDAEGRPTTITLEEDEYLDITYILKTRIDLSPLPFTLNTSAGSFSGTMYPVYSGAAAVDTGVICIPNAFDRVGSGRLDVESKALTGTERAVSGSTLVTPYVKGTFYSERNLSFGPGEGNLAGGSFSSARTGAFRGMAYFFDFETPVPKGSTNAFSMTFRTSVGRG